jgi:hypothetical protein
MSTPPRNPETPLTNEFRDWLSLAIQRLGLSPATVSRAIGAGINSVGAFLRDPKRDVTLARAAQLERYLRMRAKTENIPLPRIGEKAKKDCSSV